MANNTIYEECLFHLNTLGDLDKENDEERIRMNQLSDWIWIDAICIDQSSGKEKNNQVSMMRMIYQAAHEVIVWLGDIVEPIEECSLSRFTRVPTNAFDGWLHSGLTDLKLRELILESYRVWWERLWVAQEIVSNEKVLICIGNICTPLDLFSSFVECMLNHISELASLINLDVDWVREGITRLQRIWLLRTKLRHQQGRVDIVSLLRETSPWGITNPRDRVYSLLGLPTDTDRLAIPVDYDLSLADVFSFVIKHEIEQRRSLAILFNSWPCGAGELPSGHKHEYWLPSWMPNFLWPMKEKHPFWFGADYTHALDVQPRIMIGKASLYMEAISCGSVRTTHSSTLYNRCLGRIIISCNALARKTSKLDCLRGLRSRCHPLKRLVLDSTENCAKTNVVQQNMQTDDALYWFLTEHGSQGLAEGLICGGDEVIFPLGSPVPAIVRLDNNEYRNGKRIAYSLISSCHINGMMEGQLMALYKEGKVKSKTYHLR